MSELRPRSSCPTRSLSERRLRPYNITVIASVVNSVANTANATNLPLTVSRRRVRSERRLLSQKSTEPTFTFGRQKQETALQHTSSQRLARSSAFCHPRSSFLRSPAFIAGVKRRAQE